MKLTNEILSLCKKKVGYIPNLDNYKKMRFSENRGWGFCKLREEIEGGKLK